MALLIEKDVSIYGNISIPEVYVRFRLDYDAQGGVVIVQSQAYSSRESYDADQNSNKISVDGIAPVLAFDYVRATDGSDLLTSIHNKAKTVFSTDVYEDEPVLDPSTGLPTYDPSTGEPITVPVITYHKVADASLISLVDID